MDMKREEGEWDMMGEKRGGAPIEEGEKTKRERENQEPD